MRAAYLSVCTKLTITFAPAEKRILSVSDILASLGLLFLAGLVFFVCGDGARLYVQENETVSEKGTSYTPRMTLE